MSEVSRSDFPDGRAAISIGSVRIERIPELVATGVLLAACGVSPLMFVGTAAGYESMNFYAKYALIPAVAAVIVVAILAGVFHWRRVSRALAVGLIAGPISAVGLEIVRFIGFRVFHAMPGSMPMLMGVLLTNRSNLGPNVWSDLVGWVDHVLINGASFGLFYVLVFGRPRWYLSLPYAWVIGTLFMLSPDMTMMGNIGIFGHAMGPGFAITVYVAHTVFGLILGGIVWRWGRVGESLWRGHLVVRPSSTR